MREFRDLKLHWDNNQTLCICKKYSLKNWSHAEVKVDTNHVLTLWNPYFCFWNFGHCGNWSQSNCIFWTKMHFRQNLLFVTCQKIGNEIFLGPNFVLLALLLETKCYMTLFIQAQWFCFVIFCESKGKDGAKDEIADSWGWMSYPLLDVIPQKSKWVETWHEVCSKSCCLAWSRSRFDRCWIIHLPSLRWSLKEVFPSIKPFDAQLDC